MSWVNEEGIGGRGVEGSRAFGGMEGGDVRWQGGGRV